MLYLVLVGKTGLIKASKWTQAKKVLIVVQLRLFITGW
jgi:hypothetical protein